MKNQHSEIIARYFHEHLSSGQSIKEFDIPENILREYQQAALSMVFEALVVFGDDINRNLANVELHEKLEEMAFTLDLGETDLLRVGVGRLYEEFKATGKVVIRGTFNA